MKCDQCGYEHNSRSVCPKCGARVVYVDEEYLKRRREWEEAQKNGGAAPLPTDIIHSTKEEQSNKGRSNTVCLYLTVVKKFFIKILAVFIAFFIKKFKKRRGVNNPVLRDLKFEDKPETLDNSKLVLSHKVFKDHRKPVIIAAAAVVVAVIVTVVIVNIVRNIDRSDVLIFDGSSAYMASDMENKLFESDEDVTFTEVSQGCFLGYDTDAVYIVKNGKASVIEASEPEIITYNEGLDTVVYKSEGVTMLYDGEAKEIEGIGADASYTLACKVSDNGSFVVLTAFEDSVHTFYYVENGVAEVISENNAEKNILALTDDGVIVYLSMGISEYGVLDGKSLMLYDGKSLELAENIDDARVVGDEIFYISEENILYQTTVSDYGYFTRVDGEVTAFATNVLSESELYYQKSGTYYTYSEGKSEVLFASNATSLDIYYDTDNSYLYAFDINAVYYMGTVGNTQITQILLVAQPNPLYINSESCLLVIDDEGQLYILASGYEVIDTEIEGITEVTSGEGYAYIKNGVLYTRKSTDSKSVRIMNSDIIDKVVLSDKYIYATDGDGILWKTTVRGNESNNLGYVEDYYIVE